eukprot:3959136-Prymnesium_polylepis.4
MNAATTLMAARLSATPTPRPRGASGGRASPSTGSSSTTSAERGDSVLEGCERASSLRWAATQFGSGRRSETHPCSLARSREPAPRRPPSRRVEHLGSGRLRPPRRRARHLRHFVPNFVCARARRHGVGRELIVTARDACSRRIAVKVQQLYVARMK